MFHERFEDGEITVYTKDFPLKLHVSLCFTITDPKRLDVDIIL